MGLCIFAANPTRFQYDGGLFLALPFGNPARQQRDLDFSIAVKPGSRLYC